MRIVIVALAIFSLVLAGCQGKQSSASTSEPEKIQEKRIEVPSELPQTKLGLIHDKKIVNVGMTPEEALEIFNKEPKATAINELPNDWPKDLHAAGWKGQQQGFGMIIKDARIIGALYTEEDIKEGRLQEITDDYNNTYGRPDQVIEHPNVRYWFWSDSTCALTICATKNQKGELVVAIGSGLQTVMESMAMTPEIAAKDSVKAEQIFKESASGTSDKKAN